MDENTTGSPAPHPASPQPDVSAAALRTLALRLAVPRYPFMSTPAAEPQLLVGQLPPDLPFELPLPADGRIVGSLVAGSTTVVLDTALPVDQVVDFYKERLQAAGWSIPGFPAPPHGGFTHTMFASPSYVQFCRSERGPGLRVSAHGAPGKPTDVHLELEEYDDPRQSPCAPQPPRHHDDMWALIPVLQPPPNAQQHPEGGSGGSDSVHTSASLETDLDLAAIAAHYARQLEQAGWTPTGAGEHGPVAWSVWTLADKEGKPWRGTFLTLRQPDAPRQHFLNVRVVRAGGGPDRQLNRWSSSGGWTTMGAISSR